MMDFLEGLIPLAGIVFVFGIPIVAILTRHQRQMAEILARNATSGVGPNLSHEIADLRDRLNQQTIVLERLSSRLDAMALYPVSTGPVLPPVVEHSKLTQLGGG